MEPEFRQSLALFKYWCNHSNNLDLLIAPVYPKPPEYEKDEVADQKKEESWDKPEAEEKPKSDIAKRNEIKEQTYKERCAEYKKEDDDYKRALTFVFSHRVPPLLICLMQLLACCITELMNMIVICQSGTVMDVVMDYIALEIIA